MKRFQSFCFSTTLFTALALSVLICFAGTGLFGQKPPSEFGEMLKQARQISTNDPVVRPEYPVIPFILSAKDRALNAGDTMRIEFVVSNFISISAYQFALKFDTSFLKFQSVAVDPGVYLQLSDFGLFQVDKGNINCLFSDIQGLFLPDRTTLFRLTLVVKKSGSRLSDHLVLDGSILLPRAYDDYLIPRLVVLRYTNELSERQQAPAADHAIHLWPNPYAEHASVSFFADQPGPAVLRVYNACGALCGQVIQQVSSGPQVWMLPDNMPCGVLHLELNAQGNRTTKKIVHLCH
jgi:hypothetical protein